MRLGNRLKIFIMQASFPPMEARSCQAPSANAKRDAADTGIRSWCMPKSWMKTARDGTPGELIATPLGVEGNPLIRYKTGDITFIVPGKCSCGRNSIRIGPILGRTAQAVKLKDGIIYPTAIATILESAEGVEDYLIILEKEEVSGDRISLHVITAPTNLSAISIRIRDEVHATLPLLISNVATIRHLRGKESRETKIIDNRKQGTASGVRAR